MPCTEEWFSLSYPILVFYADSDSLNNSYWWWSPFVALHRFALLFQEGKSLGRNERLECCPQCRFPARNIEGTATCCQCSFAFCIDCRLSPHPGRECSNIFSLSPPRLWNKKMTYAIGSKSSKRALRRLI